MVCICLAAPTMASTGQAWMHSVQPMHRLSSMKATERGRSMPLAGLIGMTGRPVTRARRSTPSMPPGGQRLMSASPRAIASAYGRQAG
jgi:hypothetical protein